MGKTEEILETLRRELRSGRYKTGAKFPSEQKLMMRFNAARTTVNKITSQLAAEGFIERGVKGSGTRVLEPSPFPAGHLAYLGPITSPYYARILSGIQLAAFQQNYAVSFFSPGGEFINHCLEKIRHSKFMGLLVSNIGRIPDSFPIPVVYVDNAYQLDSSVRVSVTCTNYKGAVDMAEAVLEHGHREILISTDATEMEERRMERLQGFKDTLEKHGISDIQQRIFYDPVWESAGAKFLLRKALKQFPGTTVIMTDSDDIAAKLIRGMGKEMRQNFPAVITGFGNLAQSGGLLQIPGVEQHPEEIGVQGVSELLRMIADPEYVSPGRIEIETELVNLDHLPYLR